MKKIMNSAENFVEETVKGIVYAYPNKVELLDNDFRILLNKNKKIDKVGIVTAGGSGHLPLFLGYVGDGMLDGCAIGDVFASPSATKMENMIRACDFGKGVLCLYGNYGGDKMNFQMACDNVEFDDIITRQILVKDDIASFDEENKDKRRGVAGMILAYKIAGASADRGDDLETVCKYTNLALENIRTMGIALTPCIVPAVGKPTFEIEDDMMEIGMGIHGEAGIEVSKLKSADQIAKILFDKISEEIILNKNDKVCVMINGLGATPLEEQYILYKKIYELLSEKGVTVMLPHIGEFATSMEMAGLSLTIMKLDDELEKLLLADANTPFYTNINKF